MKKSFLEQVHRKLLAVSALCIATGAMLSGCTSGKLANTAVSYQSLNTRHLQPSEANPVPKTAKVLTLYSFDAEGHLTVLVKNLTSEIMVIDQVKSFLINTDGSSTSYYDPTVRTTTTTNLESSTDGMSVNLGAIAGALGVGGRLGTALGGINMGGSETSGTSTSNTTYFADQPQISLGPNGSGLMSKKFQIKGIGRNSLPLTSISLPSISYEQSTCRFSVCITYSVDNGATFDKLVTEFYSDGLVTVPVRNFGMVNDALRSIFEVKRDALYEPWYMIYFKNNFDAGTNTLLEGVLCDYR